MSQYCTRFHGIGHPYLSLGAGAGVQASPDSAGGSVCVVRCTLGQFPCIKRPNRLVHCVYPDVASMEAGVQSMREQLSGLWLQPPVQAHPAQRSSECSECGDSSHRGFACPPFYGQHAMPDVCAVGVGALKSFAAAVSGSSSACALAASAALPSSSAAVAAKSKPAASGAASAPKAHAQSSRRAVCFQWRETGRCSLGGKWGFEHEGAHQPSSAAAAALMGLGKAGPLPAAGRPSSAVALTVPASASVEAKSSESSRQTVPPASAPAVAKPANAHVCLSPRHRLCRLTPA